MTLELQELKSWIGKPLRSSLQRNELGNADCEIVELPDGNFLCSTVDTIGEEVRIGLYKDFYTMGWVSALSAVSDLAACCAKPLGLLLAVQWPSDADLGNKQRFMQGFNDFSKQFDVALLGGDCGNAVALSVAVTGLGLCQKPILRTGIKDGDRLVVMGKIGYGAIMGIAALLSDPLAEEFYRPIPLHTKQYPNLFADVHAGIDLSDGLLNAILILNEFNKTQFRLNWDNQLIDEKARAYCEQKAIPQFLSWIGEHGDYQQLYALPEAGVDELRKRNIEHYVVGIADHSLPQTILEVRNQTLPLDLSWGQLSATMSLAEMSAALAKFCRELSKMGFP